MANLYDIEQSILDCFDAETGELLDTERLSELELARDKKIENIALYIKNLKSDVEAYKHEKEVFAEKERVAKNKAESLKNYLQQYLAGEKFSTSKVSISYRKSEVVDIADESKFIEYAQKNNESLLSYKTPTINKTAVKELLKEGEVVEGASIVQRQNMQIK